MGYPWALLNAPFRRATDRFFRHIEIDEAWRESVQSVADRGPLIYVLRNVSVLDYLALDHLTHRFDLPRVGFANELPPAIAPGAPNGIDNPSEQLRHTVVSGGSAALFLKRAPQRSALAGRGRSEGAALLETLISLQRSSDHEIMMMPQTFVWTMRPERRGFSLVDNLFGPAEFPGELRMATQFLLNYKNCRLRAGDPLSLGAFLHEQGIEQQGDDDDGALVRRLTYALLRKVERERRTIVGPAHKPPDRLREEVLRSPKLQSIVGELAGPAGEGRATLTAKAREMLHEMQTIPDAEAQRNLALVADQVLTRVYAGVDVDEAGLERLRELRSEGAVVLLPSHKSHIDYVVLSYVLRKNGIQIPVIAAGDNLSFFPAGPILRRCGAFFIRRKFRGDRLYTAVVDAYMRRLMRDGWLIEIFLEGGRSRTGKLLQPMLGLLNMVVASALSLDNKRVFFVPVAIGYERLMEEGAFTRELSGGEKRPEDATELLKIGGLLAERFGSINLQFGEPLELSTLREDLGLLDPTSITPAKRRAIVKRLAHQVMSDINRVMALTPGSLVALVLLSYARRGVSYADLLAHCRRVTTMLLEMGARAAASLAEGTQFRERGIRSALDLYVKSRLVKQHVPGDTLTAEGKRRSALYTGSDVIFTVPDDKRLGLDLAKNHIVHWLVDRALVSVALLYQEPAQQQPGASEGGLQLPMDNLRDRVQSLSRLFKYEFMFRADASFDEIFDDVVADMVERGELRTDDNDVVALGPGRDGLDGLGWVTFHATAVRNFLEAYRITARGLAALVKGPLERKDLVARTLRNGARMFLQGEVERSEAVSGPVVDNALSAFVDQGYLVRQDGKLALADSFASAGGVATIEGRISAFLRHRGADEPWS